MNNKLKILGLHGYRQNSEKFKSQTGAVRKILRNHAEFHFISAPLLLQGEEDEQRSWWYTRADSFSSKDETDKDTGFEESLNVIQDCFTKNGPFHGILGFSQGAALAALLCCLKEREELTIDFKFVIIVSGFKSKCKKHLHLYSDKIRIPSLHVIGETDQVIDKKLSEDLADIFVDPIILNHDGGHFVPGLSSLKHQYLEFIEAQKIFCLQ